MNDNTPDFAEDLLRGADEIAEYIFGDKGQRRKIYHVIATSNFPVFKIGSMLCARKTIILRWIETQELRHANDNTKPNARIVRTAND